jgi:hypothetical protein
MPNRAEGAPVNVQKSIDEVMEIQGAIGAALLDYDSGMCLGSKGNGTLDLEVAAAGNSEVIKAKMRVAAQLGLAASIEDILITLDTQYHLIRLLRSERGQGLALYVALSREQANLAMARRQLANVEATISL